MFKTNFDKYACDGDTITCTVDGFNCVATIHHDDDADSPDQRQDGFWPSLDPKDAGYIGDGKTKAQLTAAKRRATIIMNAWKNDEWWYVGVCVTVSKNGIQLTGNFDYALWGVECNYPKTGANKYLRTVANEELSQALDAARATLAKLCN